MLDTKPERVAVGEPIEVPAAPRPILDEGWRAAPLAEILAPEAPIRVLEPRGGALGAHVAALLPEARVLELAPTLEGIATLGHAECAIQLAVHRVLESMPHEEQERWLDALADALPPDSELVLVVASGAEGGGRARPRGFRALREWRAALEGRGCVLFRVAECRRRPGAAELLLCFRREWHRNRETAGTARGDSVSVLITGITGFLGTELARHLLADGLDGRRAEITGLARFPWRLAPEMRERVRVLTGELSGLPAHRTALRDIEYVFHLAAQASVFSAEGLDRNNVDGTRALLETLQGGRVRRVVYASSIGAVDRTPDDRCDAPLGEASQTHPLTAYGRSKLAGERLVAESGLPWTALRIPWAFGPGMRRDSHVRVLLDSVRRGRAATRVDFPGALPLMAARDVARALIHVAVHPGAEGRALFGAGVCGGADTLSAGDLLRRLGEITGRRAGTLRPPRLATALLRRVRPRLPFPLQTLFSDLLAVDGRALRALGFAAEESLDATLLGLAHHSAREEPGFHDDGICLITGAASGIGRALARQLYARGRRVLLVDRDGEGLAALAPLVDGEVLRVDLADPSGLAMVAARIRAAAEPAGRVAWVVNCAGIGLLGEVAATDPRRLERLLDVNVRAPTTLSQAALAAFVVRGQGTLINIASSVSFVPLPRMAAYAASKAYLLHFSEALQEEAERAPGVRVLTVCPAGTDTAFQERAGVRKDPRERLLAPERVAATILDAARRGGGTLYVGGRTWLTSCTARALPRRLLVRAWGRLVDSLRSPARGD